MDLKTAIELIEDDDACTCENCVDEVLSAWQWLIDEGHVWRLQGWYGRTTTDLIDDGILRAAKPKTSTPQPSTE